MNDQAISQTDPDSMAKTPKKKKWGWKKKLAVIIALFILLLFVQLKLRRPWITPLPNVSLEPAYPIVAEADLGPDSAYRLLLQAVAPPPSPKNAKKSATNNSGELFAQIENERGTRIWRNDWSDALAKFKHHGWPKNPPPKTSKLELETGGDMGMGMGGGRMGKSDIPPPWTLAQYHDIERLFKEYNPKLLLLDQVLAAPKPQMPTITSFKDNVPYLKDVRNLTRWLAISAQYRAAQHDYSGSYRDLERILQMGNLISRGGSQINNLVGIACQLIAAETAWSLATREDLPLPILKQMAQAFLDCKEKTEPFPESLKGEMQVLNKEIPQMYAGGLGEIKKSRLTMLFLPLTGSTPKNTAANFRACYQHLIVLTDKPYTAEARNEYQMFLEKLRFRGKPGLPPSPKKSLTMLFRMQDSVGYLLAGMLLPALHRMYESFIQRDAILAGTSLFLALKAYEKQHGNVPETLAALVPDFLPKLPKDPFGDQPFHYRRGNLPNLPASAWAVYSVGKNFTDDQGEAYRIGSDTATRGNKQNLDLVWPSQPYLPQKESHKGLFSEEDKHLLGK